MCDVNCDVTSNETILYPKGTFFCLICSTNVFLLLIVYSEVPNGKNNLTKCFIVCMLLFLYLIL